MKWEGESPFPLPELLIPDSARSAAVGTVLLAPMLLLEADARQGRSSGGSAGAGRPVRRPWPTPMGPKSKSCEFAPAV